jgi:serine/threonine protein kinase
MASEHLGRVEELFHAALEVEPGRRRVFVRQVCGSDESLHHAVDSLLAYHTEAENFIEAPAMDLAARELARDEDFRQGVEKERAAEWLPTQIDCYRITRMLGEGGMGIVYEAEQEQPRRNVALKVIKPGWASPEVLRRFERESQSLARLQHPGIAQIYEAGTADAGFGPQPFFAMELIHGHPLRDYAAQNHLDTRHRLELMIKICEAVQHAHQRGLIHRDLKPGNILVEESGQPRILDFGVARVTDSDGEMTRETNLGQLVGTLAYMSPEQASGDPHEVDTRSDVYTLGVILYELLSGRLPYDLSQQLHEAARTIVEDDPRPLGAMNRAYRGDIETIVGKALEKDKARRYGSAAGLAADIQRYLQDEPITARPPSTTYQLQKFARRNRALVTGVVGVIIVLLAGIVVSTREAARAALERDRATYAGKLATSERDHALAAERTAIAAETKAWTEQNRAVAARQQADIESAKVRAVNDFLQNDLLAQAGARSQARPDAKPDPDLKVRTALDRSAARVEGKFQGQPLVQASIRQTIGIAYLDLGLFPDAQRQLEVAADLRLRALGAEHPDTLSSFDYLARVHQEQGERSRAESEYVRVLEGRRRVLGDAHPDTLTTVDHLALVYHDEGKYS